MMPVISGRVSVIIPVFNRVALVMEAVQSVLAQTYSSFEILLVDDGSTDGTGESLQALKRRHPDQIQLFFQKNQGPGLARETGRQAASGEFIQYLDSDDLLLPRKFEIQVAALRANPDCGIAYGRSRVVDLNGRILRESSKWTGKKRDRLFPGLLVDRWWHTHTPLYRRSLCDQIGPWPAMRPEDWDYDARAGALGTRLAFCDETVSCQRQHDGPCVTKESYERYLPQEALFLPRLYSYAVQAGVRADSPEMRHFARWAFSLCRKIGAMGLPGADILLALASQVYPSAEMVLYRGAAQLIGWKFAGRFAEGLRSCMNSKKGSSTQAQSWMKESDVR